MSSQSSGVTVKWGGLRVDEDWAPTGVYRDSNKDNSNQDSSKDSNKDNNNKDNHKDNNKDSNNKDNKISFLIQRFFHHSGGGPLTSVAIATSSATATDISAAFAVAAATLVKVVYLVLVRCHKGTLLT